MAKPLADSAGVTGNDDLPDDWDDAFVAYYARQSEAPRTIRRFEGVMARTLRARALDGSRTTGLAVADIGCNAGTQSLLWAKAGHRVTGIDINPRLVDLARQRAAAAGLAVSFETGSATALPWPDACMDVCLLVELLEHVPDWEAVLREACRVLRPGGIIYASTTNRLCPHQSEFDLPLYSWYPGILKRYCERLAVSTHPEWVNHTRYPAVHWFTPYGLAAWLRRAGCTPRDRFDVMDAAGRAGAERAALGLIRALPPARFLAHVATPSATVVATKR
jgi:ubiquinone/menaquinone biosynthesis C-methylase UbiE